MVSYLYDKENKLTQKTFADAETKYKYDENGSIITTTDPENNVTTFTFDDLNRKTSVTTADCKTEIFEYYPNGDLKQKMFKDKTTELYI